MSTSHEMIFSQIDRTCFHLGQEACDPTARPGSHFCHPSLFSDASHCWLFNWETLNSFLLPGSSSGTQLSSVNERYRSWFSAHVCSDLAFLSSQDMSNSHTQSSPLRSYCPYFDFLLFKFSCVLVVQVFQLVPGENRGSITRATSGR